MADKEDRKTDGVNEIEDLLEGFDSLFGNIPDSLSRDESFNLAYGGFLAKIRLINSILKLPLTLFRTDEQGTISEFLGAGLIRLGIDSNEIVGMSLYDLYPEAQEHIKQALEGDTVCFESKGEFEGKPHCFLNFLMFDEDKNKGTIGISIDFIKQKGIHEQLEKEKGVFKATMHSIGDAVIEVDSLSKIVSLNPVAEELTGWSYEDALGRDLEDVYVAVDEKTRFPYTNTVKKAIETGAAISRCHNSILRSKNGTELTIIDTGVPFKDAKGKVQGGVLVFRDITARRKIEEELSNIQKYQSISVLAAGIGHDFNNILTSILGNINLGKMYTKSSDESHKYFERAEKASYRARDLTQQLLSFAKGGAPIKKNVSITELLKETAGFALRGSNVRCEFTIPEDVWLVDADEGQLSQVIHNLVINSDQAMPLGGAIRIKAENIEVPADTTLPLKGGKYVKISISDEGKGIPAEDLNKIFEPYYSTKETGSGLGLASVRAIVLRHGGHISADSEPGVGTTFEIYIPAFTELL